MPKGDKKRKNGSSSAVKETRQMILKDDETEYGTVVKVLGDGRFTVRIDMLGKEVIGKLCGKFRKGVNKAIFKVALGSVVLLGIREYEDKKGDIVYVYNQDEVRYLKRIGAYFELEKSNTEDLLLNISKPNAEQDTQTKELEIDFSEI